jgi:hypothetical protein
MTEFIEHQIKRQERKFDALFFTMGILAVIILVVGIIMILQ